MHPGVEIGVTVRFSSSCCFLPIILPSLPFPVADPPHCGWGNIATVKERCDLYSVWHFCADGSPVHGDLQGQVGSGSEHLVISFPVCHRGVGPGGL